LFAALLAPVALVFLALGLGGWLAPLPAVLAALALGGGLALAARQFGQRALAAERVADREAQAALDRLRERLVMLEAILEGLPLPVLEIDRERRVLLANRASERLFGSVAVGRDLVASVPYVAAAAVIIGDVHERPDGRGYPRGVAAREVSPSARIIAVVDAFDAMTRPRVFRDPLPVSDALLELERCAGTQFDQDVVRALAALVAGERS
jgi:PAS domain-containing protein